MIRSIKFERLILLFIIALAFGLRVVWLSDANIWWDEGWTVLLMREGVRSIAEITSTDVHPPLYFWLLHLLWPWIGEGEFAVRFLSAAAGTLMVVGLWYLGRLLLPQSRWVPLAAALLLATSRFGIWWSQEGRMYTVSGLFITLSLAFTVRLRWQPSRWVVVGYLLATVAALYTLYILAFVLVVEGLYWLWTLRYERSGQARLRELLKWAILQAAVLAAFAPWLYYTIPRMKSWSAQAAFDAKLYLELYATLLVLGIPTDIEQYRVPVLLVMGLMVVAFASIRKVSGSWQVPGSRAQRLQEKIESLRLSRRRKKRFPTAPHLRWEKAGVSLLLLALVVPPLVVWGVTMLPRAFGHAPKPAARYLFPYAPAFYLLLAWAMAALGAWVVRAQSAIKNSLLVGFLLLSAFSIRDYYQYRYLPDDYKSLTLTMKAHHQPGDLVVLHTDDPWPIFNYHWPNEWVGTPHLQEADPGGAEYFLAPLWEEQNALWLVVNEDALRVDGARYFEKWLAERALAQYEWRFGTKRLLLFAKTPARADELLALGPDSAPRLRGESPEAPTALAHNGLSIVGWEQPLNKVRAGDLLHVAAYIRQENSGGRLEFWLANLPERRTTINLPAANGLVRVPLTLPIPPEATSQTSQLKVKLAEAEGTMGKVQLIGGNPMPPPSDVSPQQSIRATFGEPPLIELLGYDLALPSGENLLASDMSARLTLYWQTIRTPPLSYKVFTHLVNKQGQVSAQRDDYPLQGNRPTTSWRKGELIVDRYDIPLTETPQGSYTLVIGFYDPTTGLRLKPVKNVIKRDMANDQMVLGTVEIPQAYSEE
ncbi:MAG: glycosyltransferase family 39 protein [Ardenticatenaceae bacterium]